MIRAIDKWVLDNVSQPIVDYTGIDPVWFGRQGLYCTAISVMIKIVNTGVEWSMLFYMIFFTISWVVTTSSTLYRAVFADVFYRAMAVGFAILTPLLLMFLHFSNSMPSAINITRWVLYDIGAIVLFLFAACSPPKTRVPKHSTKRVFA